MFEGVGVGRWGSGGGGKAIYICLRKSAHITAVSCYSTLNPNSLSRVRLSSLCTSFGRPTAVLHVLPVSLCGRQRQILITPGRQRGSFANKWCFSLFQCSLAPFPFPTKGRKHVLVYVLNEQR